MQRCNETSQKVFKKGEEGIAYNETHEFFSPVNKYWEAFVLYFNFSSDDSILAHKVFAWRSQNCKDCSNLQNGQTESKLLYVNHPLPQENLCINRTMHVSIHVV